MRRLVLLLVLLWPLVGHAAEFRAPATCVAVTDGDTLWLALELRVTLARPATVDGRQIHDVTVPFVVQVRLVDLSDRREPRGCWAPELDEPGGKASRDSLKRMALNKTGKLVVDLDRAFASRGRYESVANLSRMFHMSRLFGDFHVDGYANTVARRQINAGYAFPTKADQLEARR